MGINYYVHARQHERMREELRREELELRRQQEMNQATY